MPLWACADSDGVVRAVVDYFDYTFGENGLTAFKLGKPLPSEAFIKYVGEDRYKVLVNFILHYLADIDVPIKRCAFTSACCSARIGREC